MFDLKKLVRPNIEKLKPYSSARDDFHGDASVYLDANENSLGSPITEQYNRYPDPHQLKLKNAIAEIKNIPAENIFLGNGSDECIDLLYRCFCEPSKDNVIICPPTYGMYEVCANINDIKTRKIPLSRDFQLRPRKILNDADRNTKLVWICSPNNPTGNLMKEEDIKAILQKFRGLVVIDEAYADFCGFSWLPFLNEYPNLVVMQTFSKAWGLAALRLGICFASKEVIHYLDKAKPPYNINLCTQQTTLKAIKNIDRVRENVTEILKLKEELAAGLAKQDPVKKILPSNSNFLLVEMEDAAAKYKELLEKGIVVRDRSNVILCENCLRITVGTKIENQILIDALAGAVSRADVHKRVTNETKIELQINLDGKGVAEIDTGLKFFDHMLEQISRHGLIDLRIKAAGDLEVDAHHTIEDVAIVLGESLKKSLGDKRGIERYGFALPMDEADAKVLVDFGGRNWIVWNAEFKNAVIGDVPTEMFFHFFKSFSDAAKCNLNIECSGENDHHKIEAIFKAFAKAIRMAVKKDPLSNYLPTTKGML